MEEEARRKGQQQSVMIWVCLVSVVELWEKEMYVSMLVGLTESKGRKGYGICMRDGRKNQEQ